MDLETEMVAAAAKLAVFTFPSRQAFSNIQSNGMESYFANKTQLNKISATLNPHARAYQPPYVEQQQQQTLAYRNITQDNRQDSHLGKTQMDEKPKSEIPWDPPVQLINQNVSQTQQSVQGNDQTSAICNLLQRQNEITTLLMEKQTFYLLPPRKKSIF